ncbi:MarR family winged helix-turn-helix transcriptional regulator [Humitalea sp. 24SJ18S-53]|uniref:MarR family winged helix-turn-helix transcriptional regulator n=1 Tax=Humitalea sp. 24SJ18S-53 TaxID=3422307 RepID=UPI003D666D75
MTKVSRTRTARPANVSTLERSIDLWGRPGFLIRRLHQISVAIFLEEMQDLSLTPVQFGALTVIANRPGIEQSMIGEELGLDRVNVGDVVVRLIKNGLAIREVSQRDRRFKEVFLTPEGMKLAAEGAKRLKRIQERLLGPLNESQRETFLELVMLMITASNSLGRATLRLPES